MSIFQNLQSITGQQNDWVDNCPIFVKDENFLTFRSHPTMLRVVEGSPVSVGRWHLRRLLKNPLFHLFVDKFSSSDTVGSPKNLIKFKSKNRKIEMNPTTLRYVNNLMNLIELFGVDISSKTIVEIGGGYGGECKIVNDFSKIGKNWIVFDLNSSLPLIAKWLKIFGYQASLNPDITSLGEISLIISNAAFSEMFGDMQKEYFDKIILSAKNGYFLENFNRTGNRNGGFSRAEFIKRLKDAGKHVAELDPDKWLTGFDTESGTGLIVFSENNILIPDRNLNTLDMLLIASRKIDLLVKYIKSTPFMRY